MFEVQITYAAGRIQWETNSKIVQETITGMNDRANPTTEPGGTKIMQGGRVGLVVKALAFHQCGPASISALGVIRGLSLLVLYSAMRLRFSPGYSGFPLSPKTNI